MRGQGQRDERPRESGAEKAREMQRRRLGDGEDKQEMQGQRHWGEPRRFRGMELGGQRAWGCRDTETEKGRKTDRGEESDRKSRADRPWEHEPMVRGMGWEGQVGGLPVCPAAGCSQPQTVRRIRTSASRHK